MGFAVKKSFVKWLFPGVHFTPARPAVAILDQSDEDLMAAYRHGDAQAFQVLLARHQKPLFRYLQRMLGEPESAEDAFQEAWLKLIRSREEYRPSAKFTPWLYAVARNVGLDQLRRRRVRLDSGETPASDSDENHGATDTEAADDVASARQLRAHLERLLARLSPEQREVFLLREDQKLAYDDIARLTAAPLNTVKSRMRYALQSLRDGFRELGITSP